MAPKSYFYIGGILGFVIVVYLAVLWQPERQVQLHQRHWLQALEDRKWKAVDGAVSQTYSDRWGHDKKFLLQGTRQVFSDFVFLTITQTPEETVVDNNSASCRVNIRLAGTGGAISQFAIQKCQQLKGPFVFRWQKQSWRPWDWQLVEVDHPELKIDENL